MKARRCASSAVSYTQLDVYKRQLQLGVRLKLYQRRWGLERGITHVRWTFDPFRYVNATLNLHRLGATAATYLPDYYGEMAGINSGLGSDRLLVDWELGSHTVAALAEGRACPCLLYTSRCV